MRTILITGCSSGIGEACALRLKEDGWQVHATARKPEDIDRLKSHGLFAHYLDYSDTNSIHACVKAVREQTGDELHALFNNGAYGQPGALEDLPTDVLREQFEANFFGWHELTLLVLPLMRAQGHGRLVHCSSILGWIAAPYRGTYNASKFALEGWAGTLRQELIGSGIHVSLIEPGPIATKFSENGLTKFLEHIDPSSSIHSKAYENELRRLRKQSKSEIGRFTLPANAVYSKLKHALDSEYPKAHYPLTIPTHVMNLARRILPTRLLDRIIVRNT